MEKEGREVPEFLTTKLKDTKNDTIITVLSYRKKEYLKLIPFFKQSKQAEDDEESAPVK